LAIQRRLVEAVEVTESHVHVIRLKDIFDASTVSEFEKVVSYLLTRNFYKVVVDLGHVEFISSAGWGAFTAELRRVRQNQGDVKLANMSPDVYDVFLLLELDSFIQSFDAVDEALAAFSQPAVAPEPEPVRSSILQEIKAASHAREMAEAGERAAAEKTAPAFFERWRERPGAGQESYAAAYAAFATEKAASTGAPHDNERVDKRIEHTLASAAPVFDTESTFRAPREEKRARESLGYAGDDYAGETGHESFSFESHDEGGATGQAEYGSDDYASEGEYESPSADANAESGAAGQAEYAGDVYADEAEYENASAESYSEDDVAEQAEYAGDGYADEGEYETSAVESNDESGTAEQAEYAGDDYASKSEYESFSAESADESGAAEPAKYAGDVYADEAEYEDASAESYGEDGVAEQAEYAGDGYADEGEHETSAVESNDESGTAEQAEYAGDDYASKGEYESYSAESADESGAAEPTEYAGDVYADEAEYEDVSAESYGEGGVAEQAEYAGNVYADEAEYEDASAESYSEGGVAEQAEYAGDGYADEGEYESSSVESDDEYGAIEQDARVVEARNDYAIADEIDESDSEHLKPPAANDPEMWELILASGKATVSKSESFAPDTSLDADNAFDEFAKLGIEPNWGFAGHEPFVEDNSRTGADAEPAIEETGFEHAQAKASPGDGDDEEFDELETQDIRDPWILDEIDTLPEEYEMGDGATGGEEPSFSASELLAYDLELDASFSPLPEQARDDDKVEAADESTTQFEALSQAGVDDSFVPPAKYAKKRTVRPRKSKPKNKLAILRQASGAEVPITPHVESAAPFQTGATDSAEDSRARADEDETRSEKAFAPSAEAPAFLQENDAAENFFAPPALDEHGELIARVSELPSLSSHNGNDEPSPDYPPDGALPKIPASDNFEEIVRAVVATHPDFGAAMICKFIEDRFEPPVFISRSTVYRLLREADLNTRAKRQEYADQLFDPSVLAETI